MGKMISWNTCTIQKNVMMILTGKPAVFAAHGDCGNPSSSAPTRAPIRAPSSVPSYVSRIYCAQRSIHLSGFKVQETNDVQNRRKVKKLIISRFKDQKDRWEKNDNNAPPLHAARWDFGSHHGPEQKWNSEKRETSSGVEWVSGANEWADGRANDPVLTSGILVVLDHIGSVFPRKSLVRRELIYIIIRGDRQTCYYPLAPRGTIKFFDKGH